VSKNVLYILVDMSAECICHIYHVIVNFVFGLSSHMQQTLSKILEVVDIVIVNLTHITRFRTYSCLIVVYSIHCESKKLHYFFAINLSNIGILE